ncbi:uncharacterized protein METZ01_LOCUS72746 [marine metagenome]|uniref:Uncharacterized protein n=1 Tax=marine metagenome TaxID=408172 RepID=A0A381TV24_9ZZZZ
MPKAIESRNQLRYNTPHEDNPYNNK